MTLRRLAALAALGLLLVACNEPAPRQAFWMRGQSDFAHLLQALFTDIAYAAAAVFVVVEAALFFALFRFRRRPGAQVPPQIHGNTGIEIAWTIAPAVVLAIIAVPTVRTIFQSYHPNREGTVQVRVIGHQWWWEFQYPQLGIVTANEVHFPLGQKATLTLESADVIHEFWIPQLGGKRQTIPTRVNELWWTPEKSGLYYGQCTQLCGTSHANMRLRAIVHEKDDWDAWVKSMQGATGQPSDPRFQHGFELVSQGACQGCHTIQGVPSMQGKVGPNLTRFGERQTFGAGLYDNTDENVIRWLKNPQLAKPGNLMPNLGLSDQDAAAIASYLRSLR